MLRLWARACGENLAALGDALHRGATPRLGRVDDGSATTDYDEEEIARKMSIAATAAYVEWGKTKINVIDTPGSICSSTKPGWCCRWWMRPLWWWTACRG